MSDWIEIMDKPNREPMVMVAGWHQWADAGSVSSGLPEYIIHKTRARRIGKMKAEGFYLFQIPGTHDLLRPIVKFDQGYPEDLQSHNNEFYYAENLSIGLIIFLGYEPHLDIERYVHGLLEAARFWGVSRIVGLGGVYGELPYDKERLVSCTYSLKRLKSELENLGVSFSDYHGGASVGSYVCRRALDLGMEYIGLYAFVPNYDFSRYTQVGSTVRIENDFTAWLGLMKRINHILHLDFDLQDLQAKSEQLKRLMDEKIEELDQSAPEAGVKDYFRQLSEEYVENTFEPLEDIWEDEIRKILNRLEDEDEEE